MLIYTWDSPKDYKRGNEYVFAPDRVAMQDATTDGFITIYDQVGPKLRFRALCIVTI